MTKSMKALGLVAAVAVMLTLASTVSKADDINIVGGVSVAQVAASNCPSSVSGCEQITFGSPTALAVNFTNPSETITTSSASLPVLNLGWSGSAATFDPASGPFSVGINSGSLNGTVAWEDIVASGTGGYTLNVGLNGLTATGSDPVLNAFAVNGAGSGILTFQFTLAGLNSVQALVNNTTAASTSMSATLTTPEPASLSLFGLGLLGLAFAYRRRLQAIA